MVMPPQVRRTSVLRSKTLAQGGIHFRRAGEIKTGSPRDQMILWGIKGHVTNPYNNRCDELAVGEWQKLK